jgi:LPS O-antigen subunit length determinant protein (WzzB/FepE family)
MEKESFNDSNKPDDLDLLIVIDGAINFLRRSWKVLLFFGALGLLLGWIRYSISSPVYKSRSLLHSIILTNQEEIEMIDNWNQLLGRGEYKALAQILNADEATLRKIKKISAEEIQKLYSQNNPNGFAVDVWVTDTAVIDQAQLSLVHGLGNSSYVRERINTRKARFEEMIGNVKTEIAKLETTKAVVDSVIRNSKNGATPFLVDISSLNAQWIGLNEKLLGYQEELKFSNAVQVFQEFNKPNKPIGPSLAKNLVFGLIGGLFIGYVVSLFIRVRQKLRSRRRTRYARQYENS